MGWITAVGNAPFVIALLVMLGLALVELIAVMTGFSMNDAIDKFVVPHAHADVGALDGTPGAVGADAQGVFAQFLSWLHVGRVPVLMILIVFLTAFGLIGLIGQGVLRGTLGFALPGWIAAVLALLASLPLVRVCVGALARLVPREDSSAVRLESLIGHAARVVGGTARVGFPAQARVTDAFGTDHYVLVEPEHGDGGFDTGSSVLLVRKIGAGRFAVIANANPVAIDEAV